MSARRRTVVAMSALAALLAVGCSHAPTSPSGSVVDITGTWTGPASDTTGFGELLWRVSQASGAFTGTVEVSDGSVNITGLGTVQGSIVEGTLQFTLTVPAGGFGAPFDTCSTTVTGEATATATSLSGTYAGSSTCSGKIYAGQLVLRRL